MQIAVKLYQYEQGFYYYFYDDEVLHLKMKHIQPQDLKRDYFGYPQIVYTGDVYHIIEMTLRLKNDPRGSSGNTLSRINYLYNKVDSIGQPLPFAIYYEYMLNQDNHIYVQLKRDELRWLLGEGVTRSIPMILRFYETWGSESWGIVDNEEILKG